jgi:hypothetical protein
MLHDFFVRGLGEIKEQWEIGYTSLKREPLDLLI